MNAAPPKFMRVPVFAEYTGLSKDRVYKLAHEDKIKLVRLGASTLVNVDVSMAYLESLPDYRDATTSYWGGSQTPPPWRNRERKYPKGKA
jgi:excisionase family DNA binding protein